MIAPPLLELYGAKTGNCLRVALALEEAGLHYNARLLDLRGGAHRSADHLTLNPRGKVPVLVVPGQDDTDRFVLTQSNAILLWIDAQVPGRLLPLDTCARATALERFFFFVTDVIAPNRAAFVLRRADIAGEAGAFHDREALAALAYAERFLATGAAFMVGEAFSLADIAAFTIASAYAAQLDWPHLPRLQRWFETIGARPAVERGMAAFG